MRRHAIAALAGLLLTGLGSLAIPEPAQGQEPEFTGLTGEYLGQSRPGSTPELFAPGYISVEDRFEHSGAVFSPDGTEVYWAALPNGGRIYHIYYMKSVNGRWTTPRILPFTENHEGNRPTLSPDGRRLYYDTVRNPIGGPILFTEREGDGWSQPAPVPSAVNSGEIVRPFAVTRDGSLYFGRGLRGSSGIWVSGMVRGQLTTPVRVEGLDDSPLTDLHAFVSPDEDYMIIERTDHVRVAMLVISYRQTDGTWSVPIELHLGWARFPVVSPDGDYLFFMGREGIYWVSTGFVEELRPGGAQ